MAAPVIRWFFWGFSTKLLLARYLLQIPLPTTRYYCCYFYQMPLLIFCLLGIHSTHCPQLADQLLSWQVWIFPHLSLGKVHTFLPAQLLGPNILPTHQHTNLLSYLPNILPWPIYYPTYPAPSTNPRSYHWKFAQHNLIEMCKLLQISRFKAFLKGGL